MSEVKGSVLVNVARLIRATKDIDWTKYLSEKDLEIILSQILASNWYPLDTYERAEIAIFKEVGKSDLENARQWGRFIMEAMIHSVYHNIAQEKDPGAALQKFEMYGKMLYRFNDPKFQALKIVLKSGDHAQAVVQADHQVREFEAHCHQSLGTLEKLVEVCGGKEVKVVIGEHDWQSDNPRAVLEISWK